MTLMFIVLVNVKFENMHFKGSYCVQVCTGNKFKLFSAHFKTEMDQGQPKNFKKSVVTPAPHLNKTGLQFNLRSS